MSGKISKLGVILGYKCNFSCAHCSVRGQKTLKLSSSEIGRISNAISTYDIRSVHFIGGEPTLYISDMNAIVSGTKHPSKLRCRITTNGHFAKTESAAEEILSSIDQLTYVQLSYDKFHKKFLPSQNLQNLYSACKKLHLTFGAVLAIQSPLDLQLLAELRHIGRFPIAIQKVLPIGAAQKNKVAYLNEVFDKKVLRRYCPNRKMVVYKCGSGFGMCCSTNIDRFCDAIHPSMLKHLASRFYKLMSENTLGEILDASGMDLAQLRPECSSSCTLCEYIFSSAVFRRSPLKSVAIP